MEKVVLGFSVVVIKPVCLRVYELFCLVIKYMEYKHICFLCLNENTSFNQGRDTIMTDNDIQCSSKTTQKSL